MITKTRKIVRHCCRHSTCPSCIYAASVSPPPSAFPFTAPPRCPRCARNTAALGGGVGGAEGGTTPRMRAWRISPDKRRPRFLADGGATFGANGANHGWCRMSSMAIRWVRTHAATPTTSHAHNVNRRPTYNGHTVHATQQRRSPLANVRVQKLCKQVVRVARQGAPRWVRLLVSCLLDACVELCGATKRGERMLHRWVQPRE